MQDYSQPKKRRTALNRNRMMVGLGTAHNGFAARCEEAASSLCQNTEWRMIREH
jgi:hypothetical protein